MNLIDMAFTVTPKSDQQNYDDYLTGSKTVTVTEVRLPGGEQPVEVHLAEFPGRPYKPSLSMRRVLLSVWGNHAGEWGGRKLTLYGDPTVTFGRQAVGGIKISHMSHISEPQSVMLTVTRGKKQPHRVEPLVVVAPVVTPPDAWEADVTGCESVDEIQSFYEMAREAGWWSPVVAEACTKRKQELASD